MKSLILKSTIIDCLNAGTTVQLGSIKLYESSFTTYDVIYSDIAQMIFLKVDKDSIVSPSGKHPEEDFFVYCKSAFVQIVETDPDARFGFESAVKEIGGDGTKPESGYFFNLFIPSRLRTGLMNISPGLLYKGVDYSLITEVYTREFPKIEEN